uniref:Hint domain-containing protein n=1 Tax=Pinguiococcus pyrenoidosus TaxID=172671 RepID=A0A7R9U595_9STRA|mmetsp:Transcript_15301/g.58308  ORF Transcript_15301/g.58308 Transcript_15301/m.58308 type:complete len:638 (+) Transcript_15301:411-2324(+)
MKLHKVRQPSLLCFLGTVLVASTLSSSKAEAGGSKAGSNLRRGLKHSEPVRMSSGATHNFTKTVNISFSQPPSRTLDFSIRGSIAAPLRVMDVGGQDTARAGRDRETHTVSCPFSAEVVAEAYANMTERLRGEEEDAANSDSGNRKLNIFSPDDRALLENTNVYPRNAVGLLTFPASAGSSTANAICSGTFVDDDLVLTNAHCLTLIGSQIASNWWQLTRFLVGYDDGAFIDSFSITRVVFNDFDDWAILQTDHSYGPVVSVFQASTLDFGGISVLVDLLGYHGDLVSSFNNGGEEYNCTTRGIFDSNQIRHDCDSTGGSSGSSLMGFLTNGDGPFVVALHHAALTNGADSGDLTYAQYSDVVANLAIPTGIFWNELQTALEWPAAGTTSPPNENPTPSPTPVGASNPDPDSDDGGGGGGVSICFVESSVVLEKGGGEVQLRDLQIGDEVLTLSPETGKLDYSPVVALPHGSIDAHSAEVVTLRAGPADTELQATPGHLVYAVADCSQGSRLGGQLVPIERVEAGQCVAVVADATEDKASLQVVSHVERRSTSSRVLSVVTLDGQLPLVNGVAASSFAVSNFWPGVYYNIHRLAYLSGLRSALGASAVDWIGTYVGVAAVAAVNFFDMSNTLSLKRG